MLSFPTGLECVPVWNFETHCQLIDPSTYSWSVRLLNVHSPGEGREPVPFSGTGNDSLLQNCRFDGYECIIGLLFIIEVLIIIKLPSLFHISFYCKWKFKSEQ